MNPHSSGHSRQVAQDQIFVLQPNPIWQSSFWGLLQKEELSASLPEREQTRGMDAPFLLPPLLSLTSPSSPPPGPQCSETPTLLSTKPHFSNVLIQLKTSASVLPCLYTSHYKVFFSWIMYGHHIITLFIYVTLLAHFSVESKYNLCLSLSSVLAYITQMRNPVNFLSATEQGN